MERKTGDEGNTVTGYIFVCRQGLFFSRQLLIGWNIFGMQEAREMHCHEKDLHSSMAYLLIYIRSTKDECYETVTHIIITRRDIIYSIVC